MCVGPTHLPGPGRAQAAVAGGYLATAGRAGVTARRSEAARASEILAATYAGYTKFVGGDLNDDPLSGTADKFLRHRLRARRMRLVQT